MFNRAESIQSIGSDLGEPAAQAHRSLRPLTAGSYKSAIRNPKFLSSGPLLHAFGSPYALRDMSKSKEQKADLTPLARILLSQFEIRNPKCSF